MDGFVLLLADAFTDSVKKATDTPRFDTRDILLASTIALVIALALFLWVYVRFQNRTRERGELIEGAAAPVSKKRDDWADEDEEEPKDAKPGQRVRRRKRRRRREHRPVNPTLQQTGGLPPPRPDDQLPKY